MLREVSCKCRTDRPKYDVSRLLHELRARPSLGGLGGRTDHDQKIGLDIAVRVGCACVPQTSNELLRSGAVVRVCN